MILWRLTCCPGVALSWLLFKRLNKTFWDLKSINLALESKAKSTRCHQLLPKVVSEQQWKNPHSAHTIPTPLPGPEKPRSFCFWQVSMFHRLEFVQALCRTYVGLMGVTTAVLASSYVQQLYHVQKLTFPSVPLHSLDDSLSVHSW